MKLAYVTARWDPRDPDSGAGVNYNAYTVLKDRVDEIQIMGPFDFPPTLTERATDRLAGLLTKKRVIKFYPSYVRNSNRQVQAQLDVFQPDVIFSKASIPLVHVRLNAPLVYICDSTVKWTKKNWPLFSKTGFRIMERWEQKVIQKASHILTFSEENARILRNDYHKPAHQVSVHPIPSSLPKEQSVLIKKTMGAPGPLRLLLVGKTFHGKGVDIAIETVKALNATGIPTDLRVVGQTGADSDNVQFMGYYNKNNPEQLSAYMDQYRWAHFLIFPSRFDAAGIVPSEAAGFGTPTITNAAGGLATTVEDGVSGIVLPRHSPASAYVAALTNFWENPVTYNHLQETTHQRYLNQLNWDVLGDRLFEIIERAIHDWTE